MYIVEIEKDVWLADWKGDPGRTLVKESAKKYKTLHGAKIALGKARAIKCIGGFVNAKIEKITN